MHVYRGGHDSLEEILLDFKECNKETFTVADSVDLHLLIRNVEELHLKVFEFNSVTYYLKNLKPFDNSINLNGMMPSFSKTEKVTKKLQNFTLHLPELKDKIGLFIVEIHGNGRVSRAVIKKGQLSLIQRSSASGHIAYVLDENQNICKQAKIWLNKSYYTCDQDGAILVPFSQNP
jgi:hypothetical protein